MAVPQVGLGTGRQAGTGRSSIRVVVNPTGISAFSSHAVFNHAVAPNRPIAEALEDIFGFLGVIRTSLVNAATNKPKYKVRLDTNMDGAADADLPDLSKSFADAGIGDGATLFLADAP